MDTLRQKISELFNIPTPKSEETQSEAKPEAENQEEQTSEPIASGDLPTPEIKLKIFSSEPNPYEVEFVDFLDRHAPKGLSQKLMDMLPYLEVSFLSWPAYWYYRGYNWQHSRNTERIGDYIHRTYQQAKFMQLAILATGLLAVIFQRSPFQMQKIEFKKPTESSSLDTYLEKNNI